MAPRLLLLAALLPLTAGAQTLPQPTLQFEKYTLPNGLTVILSEDHRLPLVAVDLWYHVGAANEVAGKSGFAHLFEHMMFQGSKHITGDEHAVFGILESIGATTINGTTDFDRTNYFETVPANQLETALWLESDRQGFLLDTLDQKRLDIQREVVLNEKRQDENQPYALADERVFQVLFPQPHPYYGDVIGTEQDIHNTRLEDVRSFFRTYYAPNNCALALAGDFDPIKAKALIEKYFGPIPRQAPKTVLAVKTIPMAAEHREEMTDHVHLPKLVEAWQMPSIFTPGDAEAQLISQVLGKGKTSRLYQRLVFDKQIAQDVSVTYQPLVLGSVLEIGVVARPGHPLKELEEQVEVELQSLRTAPISDEELSRAKNDVVATVLRQLERLGGFGGKADLLNSYENYLGDPGYLPKDLARYVAATSASVQAVATRYLGDGQRVLLDVVPAANDHPAPSAAAH